MTATLTLELDTVSSLGVIYASLHVTLEYHESHELRITDISWTSDELPR